jgi:hypothetical protein
VIGNKPVETRPPTARAFPAKKRRLLGFLDCLGKISEVLFKASVANGLVNPWPALFQPLGCKRLHLGQRLVVLPENINENFGRHAVAVARRHVCVFLFYFFKTFFYFFYAEIWRIYLLFQGQISVLFPAKRQIRR